jgi:hypothetical protein
MGCDMATALPGATADGGALFGHGSTRPFGEGLALFRASARDYAPGEAVRAQHVAVPQARRTHGLLGVRPAGRWGLLFGVNEQGVAAGAAPTRGKLRLDAPGLTGTDLVRLALERAAGARQAVDAATDLATRHGQGAFPGCPSDDEHDSALLIADAQEAFLLTAYGRHWAVQQVGRVRAAGEVCCVRQDWDRIAPGLADVAIGRGWWPGDGSKLDFAGALAAPGPGDRAALRRWGVATVRLEEQSGAIDVGFLRRLLADLREDEAAAPSACAVAELHAGAGPVLWCAFGPAGAGVYFPLAPEAEPPAAFLDDGDGRGCAAWRRLTAAAAARRAGLAELQAHFDQTAAEYAAEAAERRRLGDAAGLRRLAEAFMQHNAERLEAACPPVRLVGRAAAGVEAVW